jgi:c-di-AMP phosphodiesterase-like protein
MYEKSAFVFWVTLILYIITLSTVSYVGVYLTYIAIPIIVISGLIMMFFKPKPKTKEILDELSMFAKEVNQAKNKILNEVNSSLSQFNEKSELIRIKTEGLKARKHQLALGTSKNLPS